MPGTRRLYDFVDDNPGLLFLPIDQGCNPEEVARQSRMVSITQAFAIDLTGQVCVDQFEGEFYGGVSTQVGFIRGAARSPGGKPIICLASTKDDGTSRIKPLLEAGDGVGIARSDVHYVITEYGIAYLFGKSIRERAVACPASQSVSGPGSANFFLDFLAGERSLSHRADERGPSNGAPDRL